MQSENLIEFTENEKFDLDGTEDTVIGIEFIRLINGSNIVNIIGSDNQDSISVNISLTEDSFSLLDKLLILKILERRFPQFVFMLIATSDDDLYEVLDALSLEEKLDRLKTHFHTDEILHILGYNEDCMSEEDIATFEIYEEDSKEYDTAIYMLAVDNGNFTESIGYNAGLPI